LGFAIQEKDWVVRGWEGGKGEGWFSVGGESVTRISSRIIHPSGELTRRGCGQKKLTLLFSS